MGSWWVVLLVGLWFWFCIIVSVSSQDDLIVNNAGNIFVPRWNRERRNQVVTPEAAGLPVQEEVLRREHIDRARGELKNRLKAMQERDMSPEEVDKFKKFLDDLTGDTMETKNALDNEVKNIVESNNALIEEKVALEKELEKDLKSDNQEAKENAKETVALLDQVDKELDQNKKDFESIKEEQIKVKEEITQDATLAKELVEEAKVLKEEVKEEEKEISQEDKEKNYRALKNFLKRIGLEKYAKGMAESGWTMTKLLTESNLDDVKMTQKDRRMLRKALHALVNVEREKSKTRDEKAKKDND